MGARIRRSPREGHQPAPGVGAGLRLAVAGTAALGALPAGTAAVGDEREERVRGLERAIEAREAVLQRLEERLDDLRDRLGDHFEDRLGDRFGGRWDGPSAPAGGALRLRRVVDVNGDDYDRGPDPQVRAPLRWGGIGLRRESGADARIEVALDGAAPNSTYEVVFVRFNTKAREGLSGVRTNGQGDFAGLSRANQDNTGDPRRVGGGVRAGLFVLTRDGRDQFVTALATRIA